MRAFLSKLTDAILSVTRTVKCRVKDILSKFRSFFKNIVASYVPGGWTTLIVGSITLAVICWSNGILFDGAVAGAVLMLSMAFLLINAPEKVQSYVKNNAYKFGWGADLVVTVLLTILGFQFGPTMGIFSMFLGLYFSVFVSIVRWFSNKKGAVNVA